MQMFVSSCDVPHRVFHLSGLGGRHPFLKLCWALNKMMVSCGCARRWHTETCCGWILVTLLLILSSRDAAFTCPRFQLWLRFSSVMPSMFLFGNSSVVFLAVCSLSLWVPPLHPSYYIIKFFPAKFNHGTHRIKEKIKKLTEVRIS
jgi:hypothetical protein